MTVSLSLYYTKYVVKKLLGCFLRGTYLAHKHVHLMFSYTTTYRKGKVMLAVDQD